MTSSLGTDCHITNPLWGVSTRHQPPYSPHNGPLFWCLLCRDNEHVLIAHVTSLYCLMESIHFPAPLASGRCRHRYGQLWYFSYIYVRTKWLPFQIHFLVWQCCISVLISLKFVLKRQLSVIYYWFWKRLDTEEATSRYLNQWWPTAVYRRIYSLLSSHFFALNGKQPGCADRIIQTYPKTI